MSISPNNSWFLSSYIRGSTLLASLIFASLVTRIKSNTNIWGAADGVVNHKGHRRREVATKYELASGARGRSSSCQQGLLSAFLGCGALEPRWNLERRVGRRLRVGTRRGHPVSSWVRSNRNARPRMDFGELDGMMQTLLSPPNELHTRGFSLDPAQEEVVLLDLETPAILLTAGAGTGKTHTLAARLARMLGVEPRRGLAGPSAERLSTVSTGSGADVGHLNQPHAFAEEGAEHKDKGVSRGSWWEKPVAAHVAAPESILVLSFTNQGAQDVRERAMAVGVPRAQADRLWATTFHSFAATILRQNRHLLWSDSSPIGSDRAYGLDIISHAKQVGLVARLLDEQDKGWESGDDFAATSFRGERAFESSWLPSSYGRSWGMPPTDEERGREAASRRKKSETKAKAVLSRMTLWKEKGVTVQDVRLKKVELEDYTDSAAASVYASYQQQLKIRRQVDFGDLCMMATDLFSRHPEVLERYRWRLRHILVDEYQDTSPAQQRLLKALVSGLPPSRDVARGASTSTSTHSIDPPIQTGTRVGAMAGCVGARMEPEKYPGLGVSLFCAGDEDQHIYGWRGTTTDHLHRFEEDFPGGVRRTLAETHRLPVHLLRSATGLMRAGGLVPLLNRRMKTKQHTPGAVVRAQGLWNSREEGKWVALEASKMNRDKGISFKDMAVIARTAYNTRELEESLVARGIPYTVEGGSSFFTRPEVQAPLALLALCANPQDDAAFRSFISLRSRTRLLKWATPSTMRAVGELAVVEGVSYAEGVRLSVNRGRLTDESASKFIHDLRRWSSLLMGWPKLHERERGATVWRIFWEAGFLTRPMDPALSCSPPDGMKGCAFGGLAMAEEEEKVGQLAKAASRCDHIARFLLRATRAREEAANQQASRKERGGRGGRWEGMAGYENGQSSRPCEDSLEMMTMHQAKGREFKVVFLTGWDEGSFPLLPNSGDGHHDFESLERLQDERRLGYVALTRASENAIITFSKKRRFNNTWINSTGPSRFLLEMPTEYVEVLPDAIGRTLNDYPGLAGSHRLAFDGLIQAGKIRRSRPVLPSAAERNKLDSSLQDASSAGEDSDLPPGCTIVNRNPNAPLGGVSDSYGAATAERSVTTPAAMVVRSSTLGVVATHSGRSRVVDGPALVESSGISATQPRRQASTERQREIAAGFNSEPTGVKQTWASAGEFPESVDSLGGATHQSGRLGRRAGKPPRHPSVSRGVWVAPAERRSTPISRPRHAQEKTTPIDGPPPRTLSPGVITEPVKSRLLPAGRYNPGPVLKETRGRKKKALLDPSGITEDGIVGKEELNALLADPTLQQASLRNYLRAILAIQHGCVRGSIPVWAPASCSKSTASSGSAGPCLRERLVESEATGRAALSTCSAQDLASYIAVLLDARSTKRKVARASSLDWTTARLR